MKCYCIVCNEEIEVQMCCSGRDCGCMGQPVEPPVCSEECHYELMNNIEKYYPKSEQIRIIKLDDGIYDK
jgi:hypothetical protein